jgi:hypothetical protein
MTRPTLLAALALLAETEAVAAAQEGDGDQTLHLMAVADEALEQIGGAREQDEAVMVAGDWLTGRHLLGSEDLLPAADRSWADVGM